MTLPWNRKRVSPDGPKARWYSQAQGYPQNPVALQGGSPYLFHEADIFTPGAYNWVFETKVEDPVVSVWGAGGGNQGMIRKANTFKIHQAPQVYVNQTWATIGLGGIQAGQMLGQPLLNQSTQGGAG